MQNPMLEVANAPGVSSRASESPPDPSPADRRDWPLVEAGTHTDALRLPARPEHWLLRIAFLALALLVPLNLPFSIPPVGRDGDLGWSAARTTRVVYRDGGKSATVTQDRLVVTRVSRRARAAGILPGDLVLTIDGVLADSTTLATRRATMHGGDTLKLRLERAGNVRDVALAVRPETVGRTFYTVFVIVLTWVSWCVGMALVAWRGRSMAALLVGGALLLVPPVPFSSGVPGDGVLLSGVRTLWQLQAASFRLFFPALLLHALALPFPRPARARALLWPAVYAALFVVLLAVTDFGREPLAWASPGAARNTRFMVGFTLETLLATAACLMLVRAGKTAPVQLRLFNGALALAASTQAIFSFTTLWLGHWRGDDLVSGINSLAMGLLPPAAVLHFFGAGRLRASDWQGRRWVAGALSFALTLVHGAVIALAVAVVLNGSGLDLGGMEWMLFITIVAAAVLPEPALRWVRTFADRRLVARWVVAETRAQTFAHELVGELDPHRIAQRVAQQVPGLVEAGSAELVLVPSTLALWDPDGELRVEGTALTVMTEAEFDACLGAVDAEKTLFPVYGEDRSTIGALRVTPRVPRHPFDPPTRIIITTICQGVSAALVAARNHHHLRRAAAELAEAEQISAIGVLAGGLAHEIKNPLAGLKMGVYMLQRDGVDSSRVERIERDVGRIDDLISGLLRLTSDGAESDRLLRPAVSVDLREVASRCVSDLQPGASDRGVDLHCTLPDEPVVVTETPGQLRLILLNLLSNAIESVDEGGWVDLRVTVLEGLVEIAVSDDGPGIPLANRDRIFNLAFTTKRGGTGIGLALVRREAERLGGTVQVASAVGAGSCFRVVLPCATIAVVHPITGGLHASAAVSHH